MYTIDLLEGRGLPIRSRLERIAFTCLLILVPLIVGLVLVGVYRDRQIVDAIQGQQLKRIEAMLTTLSDALERRRSLEEQAAATAGLVTDIKANVALRTQWSPALATVVESLPDALILTELEGGQEFISKNIPSKVNAAATVNVRIPVRTLGIGVCGRSGDASFSAVRQLQDRLRSSAVLGPQLDAVAVSQEAGTLEGKDVVHYELRCTFKPDME